MKKPKEYTWKQIADAILEYPEHDKDCVVGVAGEEGDGKSAMTRLKVKYQHKKLFGTPMNLRKTLYYGRGQLKKDMEATNKRLFIHDEAIDNFSRTFYEKDQIDFVKMMKVVRDHNHVLYMNIPVLWELDKAIRYRIRFYIYIYKCVNVKEKKPGIAFVFKKLKGGFIRDPWFVHQNEKLELFGSITKSPNFYGYFKIPYLGDEPWFQQMEKEARLIKDEKRSEVTNSESAPIEDEPVDLAPLIRMPKKDKSWMEEIR